MKKIVFVLAISAFVISCSAQKTSVSTEATHPYEIIYNGKEKILKGLLKRSDIEADTSFKWFQEHYKLGKINSAALDAFKKNGSKFNIIVFGGTWCEDTQHLLPQFFRLTDESGYNEKHISLIGVDREKATLDNLSSAFNITNVPTFIVMKDGKEIGRVVEYGKYGMIDKELGEIVSQIQ